MNKNLDEIINKVVNAVEIINEYGAYVDEYVKSQAEIGFNPVLPFSENMAIAIEKKIVVEESKDICLRVLDNAIKQFTRGDILLELKEPLHDLGIEVEDYFNNVDAETIKTIILNVIGSLGKDRISALFKQLKHFRLM